MPRLAIDVTKLRFDYNQQPILNIDRFTLTSGQSTAVIGPSGCGKTTLLHLLAGLVRPDSGTIKLFDQDLSQLKGATLDRFRGERIGLVFQRFHLLAALSVQDNVLLAQRLARRPVDQLRMTQLFERLGLTGLENRKPATLSHGQAQRVAIARALIHGPELVMADEPTSALDDHQAEQALALLCDAAESVGAALIIVTHDQRVRGRTPNVFELATQQ